MKSRIGFIILIVVALGLGIGLLVRNNQAVKQKAKDEDTILQHSNRWQETSIKLQQQEQVNLELENTLKARTADVEKLTNDLTQTSATLAKTETALKATEEEVKKRDAKINELETRNQQLDQQAIDLGVALTNLTVKIEDTQKRLATSEGDKAFLEKELKRLMAEKAELERQFNDLAVLRAQVRHLKEELSISRRIEWIRQGLFASTEEKGAQKLMQGTASQQAKTRPSYDLNVEVNADGTVKIIPPATNAPAPRK